jgi:putative aldouronate transport system permease protein
MGGVISMDNNLSHMTEVVPVPKKKNLYTKIKTQKTHFLFLLPGVIFFLVFSYLPLYGLVGAFQKYDPIQGFFSSPFVGFKNFEYILGLPDFINVLKNTLFIGLLNIMFGFPAPIILALLLNEIVNSKFKRVFQTVSYLPHFISWVIAAGLWYKLLSADGPFNQLLLSLKIIKEPIYFFSKEILFYPLVILSGIWKGVGWGSIIYLAALTGINPELYESSEIDGASKIQQIWYISLPGIKPTINLLFILSLSNILNVNFEQIWTLQNDTILRVSEVLDTYIFRILLYGTGNEYSIGIAVGLLKAIICLTVFFITNSILKRTGSGSLI